MKLSRVVLAALVALPLAGLALAADDPAGQPGLERMTPGAGALPNEPLPSPAIPSGASPAAAMTGEGGGDDQAQAPADDPAAAPERPGEDGTGGGAGESGAAAGGDNAAGGQAPADDDPTIERAKAEAVDAPAPSAPQEEPAPSRI